MDAVKRKLNELKSKLNEANAEAEAAEDGNYDCDISFSKIYSPWSHLSPNTSCLNS